MPARNSVSEALAAALAEPAGGGETPRLRAVVDALIDKAAGGDLAAIREIFDRLEGRPGQAAPPAAEPETPRKVIFCWGDAAAPQPEPEPDA